MSKYGHKTGNWFEGIVNKLDGEEGAERFLRGETAVVERELFRLYEVMSNLIVRKVRVNRNRTPQEALDATHRTQYMEYKVVDAILKGEGDEVEVVFFKPLPWECADRGSMDKNELTKALARRFLTHDPMAVLAVNEVDRAFADKYPHCTHWNVDEGNRCHYARFSCWRDERIVTVYHDISLDLDDRWIAGVRLPAQEMLEGLFAVLTQAGRRPDK